MIKLNLDPDRRFLTQFTWAGLFLFPLLGLLLAWKFGVAAWIGIAIGALGVLAFLVEVVVVPRLAEAPARLLELLVPKAVFRAFTLITVPIGFVVSHLLMALIFFLVMTPIGLVFRVLGRDSMHRRWDPAAGSYWLERPPPRRAASYFKLY